MLEITSSDIGKSCPLCGGNGMSTPSQPCLKCGGSGRIGVSEEPILSDKARKEKLQRDILERRQRMQEEYDGNY